MSHIAPTVARQALRIASRRYPASTFSRFAAGQAQARRSYVSESKPSQATVNVDTTIKAERKAFLKQTGEHAQDATMPTTGLGADAMMSPTAGMFHCRPATAPRC
jgi:cysteine desulfurase